MENTKFEVTKETLEKYKSDYEYLTKVQRPQILERVEHARSLGDLSENADYTAAKDEQRQCEEEIQKIKNILDNHILIESESTSKTITIGSIFTIESLKDHVTLTCNLTGSLDVTNSSNDINSNVIKISEESPIGKACRGKAAGDVFDAILNNGDKITYKVIKLNI